MTTAPPRGVSSGVPQLLRTAAARKEDARAIGRLFNVAPIHLDLVAAQYAVRFVPESRPPFVVRLEVHLGADMFDLWLDDGTVLPELAPSAMGVLSMSARTACFALALEPAVLRLEQALARPVRVVDVEYRRQVDLPERSVGFELVGAHDSVVRHGALAARESGAWQRLVSKLPEPVRQPGSIAVCTLVIGRTRVTPSQWRQLAPGWLVLVMHREVARRGFALYGRCGTRFAAFTVEPGQVEARRSEETSTMKIQMLDDDAVIPGSLREPALELCFQIGAAQVSLDELDALRVGDLLSLDRPIESRSVSVICGGLEVARGELIDLDGGLAVRILRVGQHG
jgi:type III secretion system YscQ/HrcQ family protein